MISARRTGLSRLDPGNEHSLLRHPPCRTCDIKTPALRCQPGICCIFNKNKHCIFGSLVFLAHPRLLKGMQCSLPWQAELQQPSCMIDVVHVHELQRWWYSTCLSENRLKFFHPFTRGAETNSAMGKDFYKILGVDRGCNDGDIKKAYKKLVRV